MKLNTKTRNVQSSMANLQHFAIKTSAKAFAILSDLYEDKIFAIMRELGTNAYDAHVEAGKGETPFYVHLPTEIESWFAIRDYGPGMDQETVMQLYTTYFDSSKTNSNDFVGALGLGSKSPFSYTDNFTVESIQGGVKKNYLAYLDESNTPAISHVNTSETDEADGIKVQFPVKAQDRRLFANKARRVFYPFPVLPEINLKNEVLLVSFFDEAKSKSRVHGDLSDGAQFHILRDSDEAQAITVVQGNIIYPLSTEALDHEFEDHEWKFINQFDRYRYRRNLGPLVLTVPIGTVDFTPSRESLSYTPQTKKNLVKVLREVMKVYNDRVAEQAKARDTIIESLVSYQTNALVSVEEARKFLVQEKVARGLTDAPYKAIEDGFMVKFNLDMYEEYKDLSRPSPITMVSYLNVGERTERMGFEVRDAARVDIGSVANTTFLYCVPQKFELTRKQAIYRIKRHMKSEKGELYAGFHTKNNVAVVFEKRILDWLGVSTYREFDENLATTKHLRKERVAPNGQVTTKSTVPSYRLYEADNNDGWLTHKEIAPKLKGYDHIVYFYKKGTRSSSSYREPDYIAHDGVVLHNRHIDRFSRIPSNLRSQILGKKVVFVEVSNGQEFKKARFEKLPKADNTSVVFETTMNKLRAWIKSRKALAQYTQATKPSIRHNDTIRIIRSFLRQHGVEATSSDSPIRALGSGFATEDQIQSQLTVAETAVVSTFQKEVYNTFSNNEDSLLASIDERFPLLSALITYRGNQSKVNEHAVFYVKAVEEEYIAKENAASVA